jgi:hypothetical protein
LNAQNAGVDTDVALALRWTVVDVVNRESAPLRAIAGARPQNGKIVAGVTP